MMKRVLSVVFAAALLVGLFSVFPVAANATSGMTVSQECVDRIKKIEGFHAIPYWDYGQWTVGFGSTCPDDKLDQYKTEGIPMKEANRLMMEQLAKFEESVNAFADENGLTFTQGQFDALVSMTYNLGTAMLHNTSNRAYQAILQGATGNDLIFAFSIYCTAGGEFLPGLMRRRLVEANMYLNEQYGDYAPESYCYVLYNGNGGTRDVVAQGYDCNLPAKPLSVPTYEGYTFAGWYTAATGGTRVTTLDDSTDGLTLYAHWIKGESDAETTKDVEVTVTEDAVNVRTGPGVEYGICAGAFYGDTIRITGVSVVEGVRWGQFEKGWICLRYTNYAQLTGDHDQDPDEITQADPIELPIKATVLSDNGVVVYNGPHTTYPQLKTLKKGTVIEITELYTLFGVTWGKCEEGWVQINLRIQLHDAQKLAHNFQVTINYQYFLNVRSGPGTSYSLVTTLENGTRVEIVAVEFVGDVPWGRCSLGWIHLNYTSFDITKLEQYRNHSFGDWNTTKEATCVATGSERRDCSYCDEYETRETGLGDHSYGDWYVSKEGNCATPVEQSRVCKHCDNVETRQMGMGDHVFGDWYETEAATCLTTGQERRDCQYCTSYETRETELTEHLYDAWVTYVEATCVTAGEERRTCLVCGETQSRETELGEHSYGQWYETVEPTMDTEGEERRDCQNCDAFETRALAKTEHNYGDWYTVEGATCEKDGQERRDCQHCEEYQTRTIAAVGHEMSKWYALSQPTCTQNGIEYSICLHCDYTQSRDLEALGHDYDAWIILSETTCTEDGEQCRVCKTCSYMDVQIVTAYGHNFSNWMLVTEATCTVEGEQCRACLLCSLLESQVVEKLPHSFGAWYIVTEATCGQYGEERRDCDNCNASETRELVATDHTLGDWYVYRQPTCGVSGEERRDCEKCDYYEAKELAAEEHSFGAWYVYKQAACGVNGEERRDCEKCEAFESRAIEAVSHAYGQWYVSKESTCTEKGEMRRDCSLCGGSETYETDPTDHSYGEWYVVSAGLERRDCAICGGFETRITEVPTQTVTKVYGVVHDFYVRTRAGAGFNYSVVGRLYYGDRVEILEQKTVSGTVWGRIGEDVWVCITDYLTLETVEETVKEKTVVYATVTCTLLNVRKNPDAGNTAIDYLLKGDRVEILEQKSISGVIWGRIAAGWICLTDNTELETVTTTGSDTQVVIQVMGTVTYNGLNIRSGCGTGYSKVGTLSYGTYVEILEMDLSGNQVWGRIEEGWIRVDGYVDLEMVRKELINGHDFGQWYLVFGATCTQEGQERRDCQLCEEYETRFVEATGHDFSDWKVESAATCTKDGQERRDCNNCDNYETRVMKSTGHNFSEWNVVTEVTCTKNGQERRDCQLCEEYETRTVKSTGHNFSGWNVVDHATCVKEGLEARVCQRCMYSELRTSKLGDHSYGSWYTVKEATTAEAGQERRDCKNCDSYETRETEKLQGEATKIYGIVTGNEYVNIRAGLGGNYTLLGKLYYGDKVEILEQKMDSSDRVWGRVSEEGWVCITGYMTLKTVTESADGPTTTTVTKTYGTVTGSSLNIRADIDASYDLLGVLYRGARVEVLEQKTDAVGRTWGRITENGWVCLTGYVELETVTEEVSSDTLTFPLMVYTSRLQIYSDTNTSSTNIGYLIFAAEVEILEQKVVDGQLWARILQGWIKGDDLV